MLRPFIPTLLLAAQVVFLGYSSSAQSPTSSSCPCTLRGSVVDSVSGQPVPRALVRLNGNSARAALTDSEGKFQLEGLPAGFVTVEAHKPGFLEYNGSSLFPGSVSSFQLGPSTVPAILKLTPEGVISGQISNENSEPLEGFTVSVLTRVPQDKRFSSDESHHAITDDEGRFRIAGLRAGSYFLEARQTQTPALNAAGESSIPSGYAPAFYPGVNDIPSAAAIKLRPGRTAQANLTLKREPFVQLSGAVSGFTPQERVSMRLMASTDTRGNSEITFDSSTGSFHTRWIPPGPYTVIAESSASVSDDASRILSFASLHINATSNLSGLRLLLQPTLHVSAVVHGLHPPRENLQIYWPTLALIAKENGLEYVMHAAASPETRENAYSADDMHLSFAGVVPGTYELAIHSPGGGLFVESATWGSVDLLRDDFVLDSAGSVPPIEVFVRDDGATVNGTVSSADPLPPAQVVLLTSRRKSPIIHLVDPHGGFAVYGLAPGTYRVFAVDDSANFDYKDPASLAKISSKIQEVTLAPKQSISINLELATVGE